MKSQLSYVFIPTEQDVKMIFENFDKYNKLSNEELVAAYNKQADLGIVGVKMQVIHVVAIGKACRDRFGFNPVDIVDNCIVSIKNNIILESDTISYIN
jgi:hypothetical protein